MAIGNTNALNKPQKEEQTKTVSLNMASGDQVVTPDTGKVLSQVTVEKPATMVAGNIKNGVNIGGVTGSYTGLVPSGKKNITDMSETDVTSYASAQVVDANIVAGNIKSGVSILGVTGSLQTQKEEQTKTVTFSGDEQEVTPDTSKVLSKVTINKPSTLIAENVKKDVVIAGVTGTYEGSGGFAPPSNSVEETYTVLAGESVEAGDFVQTFSLTGINNLNPSGSILIDLQQVSTGKYAVLYYQSGLNLKICEIDNSNSIINEGSAVSIGAYTNEDALYSPIIVFSATRIGVTYRAYDYVKFDYYSIDDVSLSLNYSHNIYKFDSNYGYYNRGILGSGLIGENKIITLYTYYGSSGNSAYVYGTVTNVSENSADSTNIVGSMDYSRTNMIYNDSTISYASARYKGKANIFVNSNNEVIIAFLNSSYFYYDVCTINNKTITFLNKVSTSLNGILINMPSGEYYGGAMNQPIMVNNYLILYPTNRGSSDSYGKISAYMYDDQNKVFTFAKSYTDDEYYTYGRMIPVNSNQFLAIRFRRNTSYTLNYQNTTYALYTVDNDGTITRAHKLSLLSNTTAYTFASLFPLSTDSVYSSLAGVNICYKTTGSQIINSPLIAKTYIIPANNNTHELMIAKESKTQGQDCAVYRLRTYYSITDAVSNGTITSDKVYINGTTKITITPDTGYDLPSSVTVTGATNSYDSTTGIITLSSPTGDVTITATCPATPSGYTVTVSVGSGITSVGIINIYDGQDDTGTLLASLEDDNTSETITCTTGYLYAYYGYEGYGGAIGTPSTGITITSTDNYTYAIFQVTQNGTITDMLPLYCYIEGTPITLADGTYKNVEDITYDDELLVWDFDKGEFSNAKPLWLQAERKSLQYNHLVFSDGSELNTVNQHRIFNKEAGKFTYPMTDDTPIGTTTLNDKGEFVTLINKEVIEKEVNYYNIITDYHINCFAGHILTSCRMSNLYPIVDMKYVKEDRPVIQYNVPEKWYTGLRLAEQPAWSVTSNNAYNFGDKSYEDYINRLIENEKK